MACPVSNRCLGMCEWTGYPGTRAVESIATSSSTASNYTTEPARPSPSHTPIPALAGSSSTRFATFVNDEQLAVLLEFCALHHCFYMEVCWQYEPGPAEAVRPVRFWPDHFFTKVFINDSQKSHRSAVLVA